MVRLKMGSGDGFLGEWLLFPYPPFVLLTYSKYGGGDDPLFVLLFESVYSRLPMPQSWVILVEKEQKVG